MNYTIWDHLNKRLHEEDGLVSGGKALVQKGERLVSAGFKGGRTGFGWFQGGKDWFRVVSARSAF